MDFSVYPLSGMIIMINHFQAENIFHHILEDLILLFQSNVILISSRIIVSLNLWRNNFFGP